MGTNKCKSVKLCVNITYNCNGHCANCQALLDRVAIRDSDVFVEQIELMLRQLKTHNLRVGTMRISGGEPLLHPMFREIIKVVSEQGIAVGLVKRARISTNATRELVALPDECVYRISAVNTKDHLPTAVSPWDVGYTKTQWWKECSVPRRCGLCFDFAGWSFCPVASGLARILDIDIWHSEPNFEQVDEVCKHCLFGMWLPLRKELTVRVRSGEVVQPSPTYVAALAKHVAGGGVVRVLTRRLKPEVIELEYSGPWVRRRGGKTYFVRGEKSKRAECRLW